MKGIDQHKVPVEKLRKVCNYEDELDFCKSSLDISPLHEIIGQERAVKAMEFGLAMDVSGYNIFVVGQPGTGKNTYAKNAVMQVAEKGSVPEDWCYIYNFKDSDKPLSVSLPSGMGREFQTDMEDLVSSLKNAIPKAFESSDYRLLRDEIYDSVQEKVEELYNTIEENAFEDGFSVKREGIKFIFIPLRYGRPVTPEEYNKYSEGEQEEIEEKRRSLGKKLDLILQEVQVFEDTITQQVLELENDRVLLATEPFINDLKEKYQNNSKIMEYLDAVSMDVVENLNFFRVAQPPAIDMPFYISQEESEEEEENTYEIPFPAMQTGADPFIRYKVNLFINNENQKGAPVIIESNPYYYNLFGKTEYKNQLLAMGTDFTMVKAGDIHLANGGYLILQAKDILTDPFVWDALKKVLKYETAVIENIGENYKTVPTVTLKPEPIPVKLKVIIVGSPIYYLMLSADEDFQKLFKVKVDFDTEMPRNLETMYQYSSFVREICLKKGSINFNKAGLAKVIEYGSRMVENQNKLSTQFDEVSEIVYESIVWAQAAGAEFVDAEHVKKAMAERKYRFNKIEEKLQEEILAENIIIDTNGTAIGQVNGLFIIESEGYAFGLPARITAQTYIGRGGVIHIERETEMSGNIHSKGVLTLAGYLGGKLAQNKPLGFTAQVTFEQLYDGVEGDSASSAELYSILSSLGDVPLKQGLAVTGSVDQRGDIQPIGGVNEKIEGFFDICNGKGLNGEQGVIIPYRNIGDLMLKDEVLEAVKEEEFHIYAINNIEEGIELLTGLPVGKADAEGKYPEGSIFYFVNQKLEKYNEAYDEEEE